MWRSISGLSKIIRNRIGKLSLGFSRRNSIKNKVTSHTLKHLLPQDIKSYGLIPELIGRLPVLTHLEPLSKEFFLKILLEPKNSIIKQYQKLFEMDGVNLHVDSKVYDLIVSYAYGLDLGARGLRSICEKLFLDALYESPSFKDKSNKLLIDLKYAKDKLKGMKFDNLKKAS